MLTLKSAAPFITLALLLAPAAAPAAEMLSNHDLGLINHVVKDPANVVFTPRDFLMKGFVEEIDAYYRLPSVRRTTPGGRIRVTVPRAGRFYPALVVYDTAGQERFVVSLAGRRVGEAIAAWDNARQRLFFSSAPLEVAAGEELEVCAEGPSGMHRVESVLLLAQRPEAKPFEHRFLDVQWFENTLAWRTNWAAACTLEIAGRVIREPHGENNHRAALPGLAAGRVYRYRISAPGFDGATVSTGWQTLSVPAPTVPQSSATGSVSLTVESPGAPVTAGVPFPGGRLASDAHLRLLDAHGAEAPLQSRTLARWPDGSVKWALLDFQTGRQARAYRLDYGPQLRRRPAPATLRVTQDDAGVTVSAGPLSFRVNRRSFGFLEWLEAGGQRLNAAESRSAFYLTAPDGEVYDSLGPPDEVAIEESGPVRACVRVSGKHRSAGGKTLFRYLVRLEAWAGEPYIRVRHTFENDCLDSEFTEISSLALRIPLAGANPRPGAVKVRTDGGRQAGSIQWGEGRQALRLVVRDFWQNYPKDLIANRQGIELGLCPRLERDEYAFARGTVDEHRLYYYLANGRYKFHQGMSKTHEFWIRVGEGDPPTAVSMAAAPADWYATSGASGHLALPRATDLAARYDRAFERGFAALLRKNEQDHAYGMLNYGDWWGEREVNWGNCEYDTAHTLLLQFLRTGNWRYFRAGEQAESLNRDVATAHYHGDARRAGGVWEHKVGHTGGYFPGNANERLAEAGDMTASHTFLEGRFDYYFLTGDRRSLDTARRTADLYAGPHTRNFEMPACRTAGWLMILAVAAYNATGDPYYLNCARIVFDRVLELQTEDGGWRRKLARGHCDCLPRHMGNVAFMAGVLMSGLRAYYDTTGDERAAVSIVRAARFVVADMWIPAARRFRYTSCPRSEVCGPSSALVLEGVAFAYRRTREASLGEALRLGTEHMLEDISGFGKAFSQVTRQAPRFIDF